jgi:hypothetical protein
MISRRTFVTRAAGLALITTYGRRLVAQSGAAPGTAITVYKSASCGCCAKWVDHLKANGFTPTVQDTNEMDAIKDDMGVPSGLRSCHTAILGKYLVEGHVPAADLRRLLAEKPAIAGLAAPGMPPSSPGMSEPGQRPEPYEVFAFGKDGKSTLYARH